MPGSPKTVASATLEYRQPIPGNGYLIYTLNDNYKSSINLALGNSAAAVPSYSLMNASVTWAMQQHWRVGAYSNNLLGRRAVFSMSSNPLLFTNSLDNRNIVSQPRQVGVRVAYDF